MNERSGPPPAAYLLVAGVAFVFVHSLMPFDPRIHIGIKSFEADWSLGYKTVGYSLAKWRHIVWFALFFPVIRSLFKEHASSRAWWTVLWLSIAIEVQQGFVAGRYARLSDLLPNVVGASLGWYLWSKLLTRWLDRRWGA